MDTPVLHCTHVDFGAKPGTSHGRPYMGIHDLRPEWKILVSSQAGVWTCVSLGKGERWQPAGRPAGSG